MAPVSLPPPGPTWTVIQKKAYDLDYTISTPSSIFSVASKAQLLIEPKHYQFKLMYPALSRIRAKEVVGISFGLKAPLVHPRQPLPIFPNW